MKGITKKGLAGLALVAAFGLASCTQPPVEDDATGGGTGGGDTTVEKGYVVQLIATKSEARAEQIKNEFAGEGYNTYVSPLTGADGVTLYRVQIGPYGTEDDAKRVLEQMQRRYHSNVHVKNAVAKPAF